ncbi:MAG: hypothetical protein ABL958_03170 [Bdellovibrionia bacterium]
MKNARTNHVLAILAGLSLLAIQGGQWSGNTSMSQVSPPAQAPAVQPAAPAVQPAAQAVQPAPAVRPPNPSATTVTEGATVQPVLPCTSCGQATPLTSNAATVIQVAAAAVPAATVVEKVDCDKKENLIERMECLTKEVTKDKATDEDRSAFITFLLGSGDYLGTDARRGNRGCRQARTEAQVNAYRTKFSDSEFRDALALGKDGKKRAIAAFRKGAKKLKDDKEVVSCHALNIMISMDFENTRIEIEEGYDALREELREAIENGDSPYEIERLRAQIRDFAKDYGVLSSKNINGIYTRGSISENRLALSDSISDIFGRRNRYYQLERNGNLPAYSEMYSWLDDIYLERDPFASDRTSTTARNFEDYLRRDQYSRGNYIDFTLGTGVPRRGDSVIRQALQDSTLSGRRTLPALDSMYDDTLRGRGRGRERTDGRPIWDI